MKTWRYLYQKVKRNLDDINKKQNSSQRYNLGIMGLSFKENCGRYKK